MSPAVSRPLSAALQLGRAGALRAGLDLVLPTECAACHRPGRPWCRRCDRALDRLLAAGPTPVRTPTVLTAPTAPAAFIGPKGRAGLTALVACGDYAEPLRSVITAWKDGGRRDLQPLLAGLLARAVQAAVSEAGWAGRPVLVVPVPSSRRAVRQRGDAPLESLTAATLRLVPRTASTPPTVTTAAPSPNAPAEWDGHRAAGVEPSTLRLAPALVHVRRVADQARLERHDRAANLAGAMAVRPGWGAPVAGRRCLVVDDVVTTGATLAEAARALTGAGAVAVAGATVAVTRRVR